MPKSGGLIVGAAAAIVVVVVADRQQRLAISVRGGNAVTPQAVLTLLERRSATPKDIPVAALLAAASRGTAYIYQARDCHQSISRLSPCGGRHPAGGSSRQYVSQRGVSRWSFFLILSGGTVACCLNIPVPGFPSYFTFLMCSC